jgi:hypothetical protein
MRPTLLIQIARLLRCKSRDGLELKNQNLIQSIEVILLYPLLIRFYCFVPNVVLLSPHVIYWSIVEPNFLVPPRSMMALTPSEVI